jgi:hypothetical protein
MVWKNILSTEFNWSGWQLKVVHVVVAYM